MKQYREASKELTLKKANLKEVNDQKDELEF